MKATVWLAGLGLGLALQVQGQNAGVGPTNISGNTAPGTNTVETQIGAPLQSPGLELSAPKQPSKPPLRVGGPVGFIVSSRRASEVPGKLWQLVNPLAPVRPQETIVRFGRLSSRPWAATTGWHPGSSAFPSETTDEASMAFVSLHRGP